MYPKCSGWHESFKVAPTAIYEDERLFYKTCEACKPLFETDPSRFGKDEFKWKKISVWKHIRCTFICIPLDKLNRYLYKLGYRPKNVDWIGLIAYRIYNGRNPFAKLGELRNA